MSLYLGNQKICKANVIRIDRYTEGYNIGYNEAMEGLNAVKASVSGNPIYINDMIDKVHELDVQLTSDLITDFNGIEVIRTGKNLLNGSPENTIIDSSANYQNCTVANNNIEFSGNAVVGIKMRVTAGQTYTVSFIGSYMDDTSGAFHFRLRQYTEEPTALDGTRYSVDVRNMPDVEDSEEGWRRCSYTFTAAADTTWITVGFYRAYSAAYARELQVELGDKYTGYEPYQSQISYSDAEGKVLGLTSVSPNMLLFSYNDDVIINAQYYRDTQIALANQILEIAMSGGN